MPGVNVDNLHSLEELESRTDLNTTKEDRFDIRRKKDFDTYLALLRKTVPEYKNLSTTNLINKLEELVKSSDSATKKQIITITSETGGALDLAKIMQALTTRLGQ
jgi:chemotaxis response regulator CheB